jgi:hypothetical protein
MTTTSKPEQRAGRLLARGLGWFSVGLGTAQVLTPGGMERVVGAADTPRNRAMMVRVAGARELAVGTAILTRRRPMPWLLARIAGDALDLALLGRVLLGRGKAGGGAALAMGSVAAFPAAEVAECFRLRPLCGIRTTL